MKVYVKCEIYRQRLLIDIIVNIPLISTWPHLRCDINLEEWEY